MNYIDFIQDGYLILVAVLNILGLFIKQTNIIKDKYIPVLLMLFGIIGALAIDFNYTNAIFQGILAAGVAVLGDQTIKQLRKDE